MTHRQIIVIGYYCQEKITYFLKVSASWIETQPRMVVPQPYCKTNLVVRVYRTVSFPGIANTGKQQNNILCNRIAGGETCSTRKIFDRGKWLIIKQVGG